MSRKNPSYKSLNNLGSAGENMYTRTQTGTGNSADITEDGWLEWEGKKGSDVQGFIKRKLEESVLDLQYDAGTQTLKGMNAFGEEVCKTRVVNANPTFSVSFKINSVTIGGNTYNAEENTLALVNYSSNTSASINYDLIVTGNIAGSTYEDNSTQSAVIALGTVVNGVFTKDPSLSYLEGELGELTPGRGMTKDISHLMAQSFLGLQLNATVTYVQKVVNGVSEMKTESSTTDKKFTVIKLLVTPVTGSYSASSLISFKATDANDNAISTGYRARYCINNNVTKTMDLTSSNFGITLEKEGLNQIYIRIEDNTNPNSSTIYSEWVQLNVLYQESPTSLTEAQAVISKIPTEIKNCDASKLFEIVTTAGLQGNVEIYVFKSNNASAIRTLNESNYKNATYEPYKFKEINLDIDPITSTTTPTEYYSYLEMDNASDSQQFLVFFVNGKRINSYTCSNLSTGAVQEINFYTLNVVEPTYNKDKELQHVNTNLLDFSQIQDGNVFKSELLNPNMDSSDGFKIDGKYTAFQVSPFTKAATGQTQKGVFTKALPLVGVDGRTSLLSASTPWTIEMAFKTYNVNDPDAEILRIGRVRMYANYIRVYEDDLGVKSGKEDVASIHIASRADFQRNAVTHLLIEYDPAHKPDTYANVYLSNFSNDDVNYLANASAYPCLTFYVNGVKNRSVEIDYTDLYDNSNPFSLQIAPTSANIDFYIFRTYNQLLGNEGVIKNYISSLVDLDKKNEVFESNDIVYKSYDFSQAQQSEKSSLIGTISIGKCLNNFTSIKYPSRIYKKKNVILFVLPDGENPLSYVNSSQSTPHKCAILLKYATELEKFDGLSRNGRLFYNKANSDNASWKADGPYKAQGSSAKKYLIHNTQYSKFKYIAENEDANPSVKNYYVLALNTPADPEHPLKTDWAKTSQTTTEDKQDIIYWEQVDGVWTKKFETVTLTAAPNTPKIVDYYKMPGDNSTKIKKLVGKVNYASSMQSHKQGACKLFNDAYMSIYPTAQSTYLNKGRKAVLEEAFLYFYTHTSKELKDVTWADINYEDCYFFGFQTWGSAKGDKATSGYNSDTTPEYIVFEGADNANACTNFKTPWAALQIFPTSFKKNFYDFDDTNFVQQTGWDFTHNKPDYLTGILFDDETIIFRKKISGETRKNAAYNGKNADSWDVSFACECPDEATDKYYFELKDSAKTSYNRFAEFFNYVYYFDFTSLVTCAEPDFDPTKKTHKVNGSEEESDCRDHKIVFETAIASLNISEGDIWRWDPLKEIWVPGGLYYTSNAWDKANVYTIYEALQAAVNGTSSDTFYTKIINSTTKDYLLKEGGVYVNFNTTVNSYLGLASNIATIRLAFAEAFKCICYTYMDTNDIAYHQAAIRFLSGTDNRAKNTYWQIIGPKYKENIVYESTTETPNASTKYYKRTGTNSNFTYTQLTYDVLTEKLKDGDTNYVGAIYKTKSTYGPENTPTDADYKIRLFQDDLDTIFATDNNGQQVKPYNLLEPAFDTTTQGLWGDSLNVFFYQFDILFDDAIKTNLKGILDFATANTIPDDPSTVIYKYFLSIQDSFPIISYNHHAEIYYETAQTMFRNKQLRGTYGTKLLPNFVDNQVENPISLSHGSCRESEVQFLRDRILLLSGYAGSGYMRTGNNIPFSGDTSQSVNGSVEFEISASSFIQNNFPLIGDETSLTKTSYDDIAYDPIVSAYSQYAYGAENDYMDPYIGKQAVQNVDYQFTASIQASLTGVGHQWYNTDLYKNITITKGANILNSINFPNANKVVIKGKVNGETVQTLTLTSDTNIIEFKKWVPSVEELVLTEAIFKKETLDFTGCNRLRILDLTGCTGVKSVVLPKSNKLKNVKLPNTITEINISKYADDFDITFESGTKLDSVVIDCSNNYDVVKKVLTTYLKDSPKSVILNNIPSGFYLSESEVIELCKAESIYVYSSTARPKLYIGESSTKLTAITLATKRMLVNKFGNILDDSTSAIGLRVYYSVTSAEEANITAKASVQVGESISNPFGVNMLDMNSLPANDVKIVGSDSTGYNLAITYRLTETLQGISVNPTTGDITISDGANATQASVEITIVTERFSKTLTCSIKFGKYIPKVGDWAYADGHFDSAYDPYQSIVGLVYYSLRIIGASDEDRYQDVRIISNQYSSTNLSSGPRIESGYSTSTDLSNEAERQKYIYENWFASDVKVLAPNGQTSTYQTGTITRSIPYESITQQNIGDASNPFMAYVVGENLACGETATTEHVTKANANYSKIRNKLIQTHVTSPISSTATEYATKYIAITKENYLDIIKELNKISGGDSSLQTAQYSTFIYPSYLAAKYFQPSGLSGSGITKFGEGNWYIPESEELTYIIWSKVKSSTGEATTNPQNAWNSDNSGVGSNYKVVAGGDGVLAIAQKNLEDGGYSTVNLNTIMPTLFYVSEFIACDQYNYHLLAYIDVYTYPSTNPQWNSGITNSSYTAACRRDNKNVSIIPCCRVKIYD